MPESQPEEIKTHEEASLVKGYYKGLFFDIPGAEVLIGGEWTAVSEENSAAIKAQNPFTLEWRLNGELLWQLGYGNGDTIEGTIIAIDDEWNGLNHLSKTFTVQVKGDVNAIDAINFQQTIDNPAIYNLQGQRVNKPQKGIYIRNGKKVVVE